MKNKVQLSILLCAALCLVHTADAQEPKEKANDAANKNAAVTTNNDCECSGRERGKAHKN